MEPKFKGQHEDLAPLLMIINEEEEYEIEEVRKHRKRGRGTQFTGKDMKMSMISG